MLFQDIVWLYKVGNIPFDIQVNYTRMVGLQMSYFWNGKWISKLLYSTREVKDFNLKERDGFKTIWVLNINNV